MATDTNLNNLIINKLTLAQYKSLLNSGQISNTELYMITDDDINSSLDTVPIGAVIPFAGPNVPDGWLICDGRAVSRTAYAELFAAIGTTYGTGDGSTTFNLPDTEFRVPVGVGSLGEEYIPLGSTFGDAELDISLNQLPKEVFRFSSTNTGNFHADYVGSGGNISADTTAQTWVNNMQPSIGFNFIIKALKTVIMSDVAEVLNSKSSTTNNTYSCDYINNEINSVKEDTLKIYTLYSSSSSQTGTITLNDSITNYDYIEVIGIGADNGRISSGKICVNNNMLINIVGSSFRDNQATLAFWVTTLLASNNTLTPQTAKWLYMTPGSSNFGFGEGNYMGVLKVLGYKNI